MIPLLIAALAMPNEHRSFGQVSSGETGIGKAPIPVSAIGGRARSLRGTYLLILEDKGPRIEEVTASGVVATLELKAGSWHLMRFGLARSSEGVLWILAEKGLALVGFDPTLGTVVDSISLPVNCQRVWGAGGRVLVASALPSLGTSLLFEVTGPSVRSCDAIKPHNGGSFLDSAIRNIISCGLSTTTETPCWWLASESTIFFVAAGCHVRTSSGPSFARQRSGAKTRSEPMERFFYPIRDVFLVDREHQWILSNQEGELTPFEEGSSCCRHLVLQVDGRPVSTVVLGKKAHSIIDADSRSAVILFSDQTIQRFSIP